MDRAGRRQFNKRSVAQIYSTGFRGSFYNLGPGSSAARLVHFVARLAWARHRPKRARQRWRNSDWRLDFRRADWDEQSGDSDLASRNRPHGQQHSRQWMAQWFRLYALQMAP